MASDNRPVSLAFNCAKTPAFKVADFESPEEKRSYVDAEYADRVCREFWFAYQAARTLQDRRAAGAKLDSARWTFFKKWRAARRKGSEPKGEDESA